MMISPEEFYAERLQDKTAEEIGAEIRRLERKIRKLRKEVAGPRTDEWLICPGPEVQLEMHCLYLQRAKEALMDTIEYLEGDQ